jgi:Sulfotransferase family
VDAGAGLAQAESGPIPDFFLVGHEKCGTTALYRMLRGHPQIFMPDLREPRFFSPDMRLFSPDMHLHDGEASGGGRPHDLESYRALFAPAEPGQMVGEASPQYLGSHVAAERIAAVAPGAKIVAILREPVSFLRAMHRQSVKDLLEDQRDLARAMALEEDRRAGRVVLPARQDSPARLLYSEHVRYLEQLRRFEERFPPSQILVLIYEDYRRNNDQTVRRVWRFLGVDDSLPVPAVGRGWSRKTVRFMSLHRLSRALKFAHHRTDRSSPVADAIYALTPRPVLELWRRVVYTRTDAPDDAFGAELRRRLKPEVQALGEHLGMDLVKLWGYERV